MKFHPLVGAIEIAGEWRDQLKLLGSINVDGYSLALACSRDEPAPRLNPAVAFVPDNDFDARHVRDAVDVLMLATILENGVMHSNGATFEMALRRLDGEPGWLVDLSPTIYGTNLNGIDAMTYFEMRPPRAGKFHHSRRSAMVDALWLPSTGRAMSAPG